MREQIRDMNPGEHPTMLANSRILMLLSFRYFDNSMMGTITWCNFKVNRKLRGVIGMNENFYADKLSRLIGDRNQGELSKLSGLSQPTISALKNRKREITINNLTALLPFLGSSLAEFFALDNEPPSGSPPANGLVNSVLPL